MSTSTRVANEQIATELVDLMHSFGNLLVHVSGEGKVDYRISGMGSGWLGMIKVILSGDVGCMKPYKGYDTCAFDQAIEYLLSLEMVPHLNSSINEKYTVTPEAWNKFVLGIKEECSFVGRAQPKYFFKLLAEDGKTVVTTVSLEPLCNEFVVGEFQAGKQYEFIGVITDYDQPKINSCFINVEEKEYEIELAKLIHFRHRKFLPGKGDYLLHSPEKGLYVILPKEDYSIH